MVENIGVIVGRNVEEEKSRFGDSPSRLEVAECYRFIEEMC